LSSVLRLSGTSLLIDASISWQRKQTALSFPPGSGAVLSNGLAVESDWSDERTGEASELSNGGAAGIRWRFCKRGPEGTAKRKSPDREYEQNGTVNLFTFFEPPTIAWC